MGAIALGGVKVLNAEIVRQTGVSEDDINRVIARETEELNERNNLYRADREPLDLEGKTIILVDDGVATGSTMKAAVLAIIPASIRSINIAIPLQCYYL